MISVVCVFNNQRILEDCLLQSLDAQTVSSERLLVDNCSGSFDSAADALNRGASRATGDYIMFVHQDVTLLSSSWLTDAETMMDSLPNAGVVGVAGMSESGRNRRGRMRNVIIEHENPPSLWGTPILAPESVQTLDECLMLVPIHVYEKMKFDEKTCDGWHFYGVDYCLTARAQGLEVFVIPLSVHHRSLGFSVKLRLDRRGIKEIREYYRALHKLISKHKVCYSWITTTNGDYHTDRSPLCQDLVRIASDRLGQFHRTYLWGGGR